MHPWTGSPLTRCSRTGGFHVFALAASAQDVEMDPSEDVAMEQVREVDFYRLDRENGCFARAGTRMAQA